MPMRQSSSQSEERQFRLLKFFAYTSLIVLILFSFPFSVITSQNTKDLLMKSHENYALMIGENLCHQVFQNFNIPIAMRFGKISLRKKQQRELLDRIVKNTIHGFNIDVVNIYDIAQGVIAYSTDPEKIGEKARHTLGYEKAVRGEHSSGLISGKKYLWGLGIELPGGDKKLMTYIPYRGMNPYTGKKSGILGVFELTQDLTQGYQSIVRFQYFIFGLSISVMIMIFIALLFIVHKAEGIIRERAMKQRNLEAQLNQSERFATLGQMVAGVSHEIRNPLGIIRSTAELLAGMKNSDETQKKLSNVIIDASGRLNNIVTEFLDFARPQKPNYQDCDLNQVIEKNLEFLQPELDKWKIAVRINTGGASFRIEADPHLLYRAFLNIFLNAVQSMNHGGDISVDISQVDGHVRIEIRDTGAGISEENLGKIFIPFFSTRDKGSGLGLAIVKNTIEAHHGSISIQSKPGSGTRVIIKLPIRAAGEVEHPPF